jgi:flagellar protein FliS
MDYKKSNSYERTSIETAGKLDLVIMCYDKAIQLLKQAKGHFKTGDLEKKARKMQSALDIINELQSCINMEEGGQIARNLDGIYTYITRRLLQGDIKNDISVFDECVNILSELKDAWVEISHTRTEERIEAIRNHDPGIKEKVMVAA